MNDYYNDRLSAERLKRAYEIAPPRIKRYLEEEIAFVQRHLRPEDSVVELGCGYGRAAVQLAAKAKSVVAIDTSLSSLKLGKEMHSRIPNCLFARMNAVALAIPDHVFDVVVCIQNGISAFQVDQGDLIRESLRVVKPGGTALFSSYSPRFWGDRLEWFKTQSEAGLIGEIDYAKTGDGVIACKDGFKATTVSEGRFYELASKIRNVQVEVEEVDGSSLFCKIRLLNGVD
jgi:SAM-dependent methyltransferase